MAEDETTLSMDEITKRYAGNYVAIEVVTRDSNGQPSSGKVVLVHFNKYRLRDEISDKGELCIFYAGPTPKQGYVGVF
jgi:hypothetical protein